MLNHLLSIDYSIFVRFSHQNTNGASMQCRIWPQHDVLLPPGGTPPRALRYHGAQFQNLFYVGLIHDKFKMLHATLVSEGKPTRFHGEPIPKLLLSVACGLSHGCGLPVLSIKFNDFSKKATSSHPPVTWVRGTPNHPLIAPQICARDQEIQVPGSN